MGDIVANPVDPVARTRIVIETKAVAPLASREMNLSISGYIRMALVRVTNYKAVAFAVCAPAKKQRNTVMTSLGLKGFNDEF